MTHAIPIHQPYDFKTMLAFLKRHVAFGIEEIGDVDRHHFPTPYELLDAEIESIGITRTKAGAIRGFALLYHDDIPINRENLLAIKGIGPWTSELIMMRCKKDRDVFAKNDLFIKKALWSRNRAYLAHYSWKEMIYKWEQ